MAVVTVAVTERSLASRAAWLVVAAVGLWVLAIGLVGVLVVAGYAIVTYAPTYAPAGLAAWGLAGALAFGFAPRISLRKEDEAPPLGAAEHPRFQAFVRDVASRAGARAPDALYLFHDANAYAAQRSSRVLGRSHSVVGIGLPLLALMTESEARAILAHEMGHHVAGDVRLGPWVHRTRRAVASAVDRLEGSSFWLHLPFVAYAELFLKGSVRVSRAQELQADALSARVAGAPAAASALRKVELLASAWGAYLRAEVLPVLGRGWIPPLLAGFEGYWRAAQTPDTPAFDALSAEVQAGQRAHAHDTHPTLAERLHALGDPAPASDAAGPALALLDDVPATEERVLRDILRNPQMHLQPVAWGAIADKVWLPLWREGLREHARPLARLAIDALPDAFARWQELADATRRGPAIASPAAERRRVGHLLGIWLAVALADLGYRIDASPGHAVRAEREGRVLEPFVLIAEMSARPDPAAWARLCAEHGL